MAYYQQSKQVGKVSTRFRQRQSPVVDAGLSLSAMSLRHIPAIDSVLRSELLKVFFQTQ